LDPLEALDRRDQLAVPGQLEMLVLQEM